MTTVAKAVAAEDHLRQGYGDRSGWWGALRVMKSGGEEGVGVLRVADEGGAACYLKIKGGLDPVGHFFIFLFKDGAGTVDERSIGCKMRRDVAEDCALPVAVLPDCRGVKEVKGFRSAAPGTAAGAGDIGKDEVGASGAGGWRLGSKVGDKSYVLPDAGGCKTRTQVMQDGGADVGGGYMEMGVDIVGQDRFAAAGGTGIPEKFGVWQWSGGIWRLQEAGDLLGAVVLDDDFEIGGETGFDIESVGQADRRWRNEFKATDGGRGKDCVVVTGANADEEVGLTKERQTKRFMVDGFREFVFPGEDVGDANGRPADLFRKGGLRIPIRAEAAEQIRRLIGTQIQSCEETVGHGKLAQAMADAIKTIRESAELFAVAGTHLAVGTKKIFQPDMERLVSGIGLDDPGRMAQLVVESHGDYSSSRAFSGSLPKSN